MAAILLGSCLGFLIFNWQPAKVFLGDAGSTFLGYTFAVLPFIQSDDLRTSTVTDFVAPTILLWLFLFDTVYTRLRQILARKRFWRAHRDHLYQKIVHSGSSHSKVAIFYGVFGLINGIALVMQAAIGYLPLAAAILIGSTLLLLWARKKEIDVS